MGGAAVSQLRGSQLLVNLGASQARKRLKDFGHGVRKVQAIGRGQSMIIHTATGEHFRELQRLFADVGHADSEASLNVPIDQVRNLGPRSAGWLREISVLTRADLEEIGPALAYRLIKQKHPEATLNLLWSMAAGLADRDSRELSDSEKATLLREAGEAT